jgi:hypothetical protein
MPDTTRTISETVKVFTDRVWKLRIAAKRDHCDQEGRRLPPRSLVCEMHPEDFRNLLMELPHGVEMPFLATCAPTIFGMTIIETLDRPIGDPLVREAKTGG